MSAQSSIRWSIAAVLLLTVVSTRAANICTGHANGAFIRNTQNCATFYTCLNGNPILTPCPTGQLFNHIERRCDADRDAVACYACSADAPGGFADWPVANECQQFVRCFNNRSEQRTCADGLSFDRSVGLCNRAERVQCPFEVECPRQHPTPIFTRHPDDCSKFTVCANGVRQEFQCPEQLHLNEKTKQCDYPSNSNCPLQTTPPPTTPTPAPTPPPTTVPPPTTTEQPPLLQCPREGGPLFPHPTNCSLTYACAADNEPHIYPCREGLHFDYEQQYCAAPSVVQCFGDSK